MILGQSLVRGFPLIPTAVLCTPSDMEQVLSLLFGKTEAEYTTCHAILLG